MGRPTTSGTAWSAGTSVGDCYVPHLRVDRGALHLVESVSDLFQIGDVGAVWIDGPVPRRTLREGINEELLNTTRVDLEMKLVRNRV